MSQPDETDTSKTPEPYLVQVSQLVKHFPVTQGLVFERQIGAVKAVDGISLQHRPRRDAGAGGRERLRQDHRRADDAGAVPGHQRRGEDRRHRGERTPTGRAMLAVRRKAQMIFQDPYASLNPRWTVSGDRRRAAARAQAGEDRQGARPSGCRSCCCWWA